MPEDLKQWLERLELEKYADFLEENEVALLDLPHITEQDLKDLGLPLGPRRRLLANAAKLAQQSPETSVDESGSLVPMSDQSAERRQLTVMFVDLVGSTSLSAGLDPEEMREVIRGFQNAVAGEITRLDGHVAKFMGDGALAYFGWPRAHENEAERAVRAGMALLEAIEHLITPDGTPLAARMGIATGLVVVGDLVGEGSAREEAVVGDTPNLAARLQALARPGQIVVAETTSRLLGGLFDLENLGQHDVKGLAAPIAAYAVVGERTLESRFAGRDSANMSEIVGRDQELALLMERWGQAVKSEGQMVLLTGEAGIGKSRITQAIFDELRDQDHTKIRYQCSPYHTDSALYPAIQQLRLSAGFAAQDNNDARLDKLEALLRQGTSNTAAHAPLIAPLLALDAETRYGASDLSPEQLRSRLLQALIDQLVGLGEARPVCFVIEDAHWIDPTTLELVELALNSVASSRILVLMTARPTFEHGFGGHPVVTRLMLNRLGRSQVANIVARVGGGKPLPAPVLDEITAKTDGIPLFVEEIAKVVLESGTLREEDGAYVLTGPLSALSIPATLHDSLMARLDRLHPVKEIAQIASVIGRTFDYQTLAAITSHSDGDLAAALDRLVEAELLFRRGTPPEANYLFKHALVRDAAYESLLKSRRQTIHADLLTTLEAKDDAHPEILAYHAEQAGETEKAIWYWARAGDDAFARPAHREAVNHYESALRLVRGAKDGERDSERELELLLRLNHTNMAGRGYAHPVTVDGFAEARRLVNSIGESPHRFPIYYGNWVISHVSGQQANALEIAEEIFDAASGDHNPDHSFMSARSFYLSRTMTGAFETAERDYERVLELYDPERETDLTRQYGQSPHLGLRCYRAIGLACRGFPSRAWDEMIGVPEHSEQLGHSNTIGYAYTHYGMLAWLLGKHETAEEFSRRAIQVAEEHGLVMWKGIAMLVLAAVLPSRGQPEEAVDLMEEGMARCEESNTHVYVPYLYSHHVANLLAVNQHEQAVEARDKVITMIDQGSERWANAEIFRMLGDSERAGLGGNILARKFYLQALGIARKQNAKLWELRTSVGLARLMRDEGETSTAQELLAPIYAWFSEGQDTPDLTDAKGLLDEFS
ncbi:AAA family ATPase [Ruegeria hyattellae]|uniref:AAA family ATPase n=1 Tax=Ruegeria hyattellae TaxID=3233337 RepID=UPI00355B785A